MAAINVNKAEFIKSAASPKQFIRSSIPSVVFAGKSNVGKSSVINRLLNRKNFARVGAQPGKTIHVNYFYIDEKVYFVDLPGYGYAKKSYAEKKRWAELMEGFFNSDRNISLVVQLIDARHKPSADDYDMLEYLKAGEYRTVIVMTKIDKLNKTEREKRIKELETELSAYAHMERIPFSSVSGEGVDALKKVIEKAVN